MRVIIQAEALRRSEKTHHHQFIHELPTIEAVPVVHARWKQGYELVRGMEDNSEVPYVACSNCGQTEYGADLEDYTDYDDLPNYCPNCGAKMDGGAQE